jgi:hypothetical protein
MEADRLYVPASQVLSVAAVTGAIAYDVSGVELGHVGEFCQLRCLSQEVRSPERRTCDACPIIRGADPSRSDPTPQSAGPHAFSLRLSRSFADNHAMLSHGLVMVEALYAWCEVDPDRPFD